MDLLNRLTKTTTALRGWAIASLVSNVALIVTGGIVRVTSSGLGCPTWPRCFPDSYVATPASGLHGMIEFGNRLLTFVLAAIAIGTVIAALRGPLTGPRRRRFRIIAVFAALGIPLQAVVGGLSVLFQLNPYVVALHLLLSVVLIGLCVALVHLAYDLPAHGTSRLGRSLVRTALGLTGLVILLGTFVTGAGPHSGDGGAQRNGMDLESIARIHALSVWALVAVTVAAVIVTRAAAVVWLLVVELAQGLIGYVQYFTHLPAVLVVAHLLGVAVSAAAATHAYLLQGRQAASITSSPEEAALVG